MFPLCPSALHYAWHQSLRKKQINFLLSEFFHKNLNDCKLSALDVFCPLSRYKRMKSSALIQKYRTQHSVCSILKYKFSFCTCRRFCSSYHSLKSYLPNGLKTAKPMYQTHYCQRNETWKKLIYLELHHSVTKPYKNKFLIQSRTGSYDKC